MKIYVANDSKQGLGGGFTFIRNFIKGCPSDVKFVDNIEECDVFFIPSATMVLPETFNQACLKDKKIILRVDNMPKKSRNRRSRIYDRIKRYSELASTVIYQSRWARYYVGHYLKRNGIVIHNGVDKDVFKTDLPLKREKDTYMFSQFNRDETKQMHKAFYYFHTLSRENKKAKLRLVGQFSPELVDAGFDFFCDELIEYWGIAESTEQMSNYLSMTENFIYSYYNDACSNSLLEAIACGCKIIYLEETGGAAELMEYNPRTVPSIQKMCKQYLKYF